MDIEGQSKIENVKQYYEILRTRQKQIIEIIKETTQMLAKVEAQQRFLSKNGFSNQHTEKNVENGTRLAYSMINALANILDEQMKALNIWEEMLFEDKHSVPEQNTQNIGIKDYYVITSN